MAPGPHQDDQFLHCPPRPRRGLDTHARDVGGALENGRSTGGRLKLLIGLAPIDRSGISRRGAALCTCLHFSARLCRCISYPTTPT